MDDEIPNDNQNCNVKETRFWFEENFHVHFKLNFFIKKFFSPKKKKKKKKKKKLKVF
jgi:hypothetical protein